MYERLMKLIQEAMPDKDLSGVTKESRLMEDLGMDSIGMMMLSMAIEDEFGFEFDEPVLFQTVGDVCKFLEEHATK